MSALITIGMVLGGLILAFTGVTIFDITLSVVGFGGGALVGYLYVERLPIATAQEPSLLELTVATLISGLVGLALIWTIIKLIVLIPGFIAGAGATATLLDPGPATHPNSIPLLIGGVVGAAIAWALFRIILTVVTAFLGAAMVALAGSIDRFIAAARALNPAALPLTKFNLIFWTIFILGTLSQLAQLATGHADTDTDTG